MNNIYVLIVSIYHSFHGYYQYQYVNLCQYIIHVMALFFEGLIPSHDRNPLDAGKPERK